MTEFKVKVSDILVDDHHVRVGVFIALGPNRTFVRCGELALTPAEGKAFKEQVEGHHGT